MLKENFQQLNLQVTDGLAVAVIQNPNYEFVMSVKDVALGYGVSSGNIRNQMFRNQDEFIEGKHFVKGVCFSNALPNVRPNTRKYSNATLSPSSKRAGSSSSMRRRSSAFPC